MPPLVVHHRAATETGGPADLPIGVADIEVDGVSSIRPPAWPSASGRLQALVRIHTHPVGTVMLEAGPERLSDAQVAQAIWSRLGEKIVAHLLRDGGPPPRCLQLRSDVLAAPPLVSVIVATKDRTSSLARCLNSVLASEYPRFEVIVVDNDPTSRATATLIESRYAERGVRYAREVRRGLAAAHNRGLDMAAGSILAFTDDDVVVDQHWLAALVEAFRFTDHVGAVTGLIQPGELRTPAQVLLERHGSFAKGFEPRIFDLAAHRPADRRFPLATGQCGSGANMAFDAGCLRGLGGFDPALGTGTPARGGDDLAAFLNVLVSGQRLVYQPAAVVRHWHRDTDAALAAQAYGYGLGLTAYLTDAVLRHPDIAIATALGAARARVRAEGRVASPTVQRYAGWPREVARLGRRGALAGPLAYLAARWNARGAWRPA